MMTRRLGALLALVALMVTGVAHAATAGELEPAGGTWRVYRGPQFTTRVCSAKNEAAVLACASEDAKQRGADTRYQVRYPNRYVTFGGTVPAPTCTTPAPPVETRTNQCAAPATGTWTQTCAYTAATYPTCWTPGQCLPATAPAGSCTAIEPPQPPPTGSLFTDDFRSGAKGTSANGVGWLGRGENISVVPYPTSPSGYAMRFRYDGVSSGQDSWAEQRFTLPDLTDVWVQVVLDIPANYVHRNDTSSDNNKLIRFWNGILTDGNDGYSKYAIKGGFSTVPSSDGSSVIVEFGRQGDSVGRNSTGSAPLITAADKGKRLTLTFHAKTDTKGVVGTQNAATGGNGALELYKNGKKVIGYTSLQWRSVDGKGEKFSRGYLLGWANSGFAQTTDMHVVSVSFAATNVYGVQ